MMKRFMLSASAAAVAIVSSACYAPADPDPGVCRTSGDFEERWVEANTTGFTAMEYTQMVCEDWVWMLVSNCVEVYGLELFPSDREVALYCAGVIARTTDADGEYHLEYTIDHSCNFIDNPNYECSQYGGSASQPGAEFTLDNASAEAIAKFNAVVNERETLSSTVEKMSISIDSKEMTFAEFLNR